MATDTKYKRANQHIIDQALKDVKAKWGAGWLHLSGEQKRAEIAYRIVVMIGTWVHHEGNPAVDLCNAALATMADVVDA